MKKITFLVLFIIPLWLTAQIPSYYNDVNLSLSGTALKDELATKVINTHTIFLSYSQVWDASKITDLDPNDVTQSNVILIYGYNDNDGNYITDRTRDKNLNGGTAGSDWNREHTYAKSLGTPNLGTSEPGSDAHHLRPSDVTFNGQRSSKKFADGIGNAGDSNGGWYAGDEWKGDIARMMMYMYLRYGNQCLPTGVGIGSSAATPDAMIDLFLQWNAEDPVSQIEKTRNEYHGNNANAFSQGNRNPFIDNPAFATQIWNGPQAEDLFGNITPDTEAPTAPTNLISSNITNTTLDLNWTASTDNIAVSSYDIFKDGVFLASSNTNSYAVINLTQNTTYNFTVFAKDAAGNTSTVSATETVTTANIIDTQAPTTITDLAASNTTSTTTSLIWTAATDNIGVTSYEISKDGVFLASTSVTSYNVSGLTAATAYTFTVIAKDAAGNTSTVSSPTNVTTLSGGGSGSGTELFISEYVEGSSNNKAIEIANITGSIVDLSIYSLKRNTNGGTTWGATLNLVGQVIDGDVFVIANSSATAAILNVADLTSGADAIIFNGNDPVGLFKNNVLIDIVGPFNNGTANFAKDVTLRRIQTVTSPSTVYNTAEWDSFTIDTFDGLGTHTTSGGGGGTTDTQAPTAPTNVTASVITETTLTLNWTASTDNVGVTSYDVFKDGVFLAATATSSYNVTGLNAATTYAFTVFAKDAAANTSTVSNTVNATTIDNTAPSAPTGLAANTVTETTLTLNWTASTDNVGVTSYDVFKDGVFLAATATNSYGVTGLNAATSYTFTVFANDAAGNTSTVSSPTNVTTLSGGGSGSGTELFISEYVEGSSNNKAIEIANITGSTVDLSIYSLKRNTNGGASWGATLNLVGQVIDGKVFVVANSSSTASILNVAGLTSSADAIIFNGNDPVGLFKNNVLIDIVGPFNNGTANFAKDITLRRIETVTSPSSTYNSAEWDSFTIDTFDGLGTHTTSGGGGGTTDTQAPTAPTNVTASVITETILTLNWTASTDNVGVTSYDVFKDGVFLAATATSSYNVTGLNAATAYTFTVFANDAAANTSTVSSPTNVTTLSGGGTPEILFSHSFETGWDGWSDGGSDCYRIKSTRSFDGNYSIRIRDNSGIQSAMTSSTYDVSTFNDLEIKFNFYSNSMETNEDFWLQYFDGSSWQTVQTFVSGADFNNDAFTEAIVVISTISYNFPTNAQFRFQNDASSNSDNIYIDNVTVTANAGLAAKSGFKTLFSKQINDFETELPEIEALEFYPNPASNNTLLRTEIDVEDDIVNAKITIVNLQGMVIKTFEINSLKKEFVEQNIDVSNLKSGIYFVNIISSKGLNTTKKLIVK